MPQTSPTPTAESALAVALALDTLSVGFRYPDADFYRALTDGQWERTLAMALAEFTAADLWQSLHAQVTAGIAGVLAHGHTQLQSDYIALFDSNRANTPLRLYAHLYSETQEPQVAVLQRLQARYHAQGITLASGAQAEQADHLCVQLDFMALLYQRLHQSLSQPPGTENLSIKRAIAEFQSELVWIPRFAEALAARSVHVFYTPLSQLLARCIGLTNPA